MVAGGGGVLFGSSCLFAAHEREQLLTVSGGPSQTYAFNGAQLVGALWLAGGYLLQVGVVEHDVGGDLLAPRLFPPPAL